MIRRANIFDINKINSLSHNLYPNFENIFDLYNYVTNDKYIVLVNEDSFVNAFMLVYCNIDYYELLIIVVDDDFQNKGIGTKLMSFFIDSFCKKGDIILLEVSSKNNNAIKFYEKFYFETINIRKNYYKDSDAFIMKKVI